MILDNMTDCYSDAVLMIIKALKDILVGGNII